MKGDINKYAKAWCRNCERVADLCTTTISEQHFDWDRGIGDPAEYSEPYISCCGNEEGEWDDLDDDTRECIKDVLLGQLIEYMAADGATLDGAKAIVDKIKDVWGV